MRSSSRLLAASLVALAPAACGSCRGARSDAPPDDAPHGSVRARIGISLAAPSTPAPHLIGYLHGIAEGKSFPKPELVARLKPRSWRVSDPWHVRLARSFGAEITYSLWEGFTNRDPRALSANDFERWEGYVREAVRQNLEHGSPVSWWDPWSEPALDPKNRERFAETFRRAHDAIRATDPKARITAPCLNGFSEPILRGFLDDAVAHGRRYDAICWHEFDRPDVVPDHVRAVRTLVAARPSLGEPEVHINEYASYEQHLIPGFEVAWLAELETAGVDSANRACWDFEDETGKWIDCFEGLDGLLMRDSVTPQAVYWVHQRYGELGTERIRAESSEPRTYAIAGLDPKTRSLRVLVGRADATDGGGASANTEIVLDALSGAEVDYAIDRIPNRIVRSAPAPLLAPIHERNGRASAIGGTASIQLGTLSDGDVIAVTIRL